MLRSNSDEVEMNNDCFAIYTSPPPAAEHLLKEKTLKGVASKPYVSQLVVKLNVIKRRFNYEKN